MFVLFNIPEEIYNTMDSDMFISREQLAVLQKHILDGTIISENATNGVALCALYPNMRYIMRNNDSTVMTTLGASSFLKEWWDSKYKGGD